MTARVKNSLTIQELNLGPSDLYANESDGEERLFYNHRPSVQPYPLSLTSSNPRSL